MKKILYVLLPLSALLFFSCATTQTKEPKPLQTEDHSNTKKKTSAEFKKITKNEKYLEANIEYPQFKNKELLSKTIENSILNYYNNFCSTAEDDWKELDRIMHTDNDAVFETNPFGYEVTSQVFECDEWTSVLITTWIFSGGAHGNYFSTSYNWNEKTQKLETNISNATGFTFDYIAEECRRQIIHQLSKDSFDVDLDWVYGGTEPQPGNFEVFTMEKEKTTIYFDPYIVAPYVCGTIEVEIPLRK